MAGVFSVRYDFRKYKRRNDLSVMRDKVSVAGYFFSAVSNSSEFCWSNSRINLVIVVSYALYIINNADIFVYIKYLPVCF